MNHQTPKSVKVFSWVAVCIGVLIALAGFSVSVFRQYTFIYYTLDHTGGDLVSLVLSYLSPFCVDGFILYVIIRLRYEWHEMSVAEIGIIAVYGIFMVIASIVANIIEANRVMGMPVTDRNVTDVVRYILPTIPILSSLVMFAIHMCARRSPIEQALADMHEDLEGEEVRLTREKTRAVLPKIAEARATQYASNAFGVAPVTTTPVASNGDVPKN